MNNGARLSRTMRILCEKVGIRVSQNSAVLQQLKNNGKTNRPEARRAVG